MTGHDRQLNHLMAEIAANSKKIPFTKNLEQLLTEPRPFFLDREQQEISVSKNELLKLADIIPGYYHSRVELPFLFQSRSNHDHFVLKDNDFSSFIVENIIDSSDEPVRITRRFFKDSYVPKYPYYYRYMIYRVKKHFPSLVFFIFSIS